MDRDLHCILISIESRLTGLEVKTKLVLWLLAVTGGGQLTVSMGSTMATSGKRFEEATAFFTFDSRSRKMACLVTSAPVPEVVGTMMVGFPRLGTFSFPK